jgi:hypothetical protein
MTGKRTSSSIGKARHAEKTGTVEIAGLRVRTMCRFGALFAALIAAVGADAAGSGNPVHDRLLTLPSAEQARVLGHNVGRGCVGVTAFPMGVTESGKAKGLAYWSVRCKDGRSFALQIAPDAKAVVIDCRLLQANGKDCFKKF